ncbi:probable arabinose 5-phosphate isomerase isoform X2 [Juglans microcarpa x Juglans regia]|uniref:probable arabinose 5-phosphate isomerase isoform X2 n=1 Tax=Juglans microcarpa x Juglans regia TaxID=2249226 RepID=UPI001B7EBB01|nr:probable arabinose 5-phosphate isomerase isoform X2 [Juglans microcarpa x Juglans regia]
MTTADTPSLYFITAKSNKHITASFRAHFNSINLGYLFLLSLTSPESMGSLPLNSSSEHLVPPYSPPLGIDESTLLTLFKSQQNHLNFFFENLSLPQTLSFARILLSASGTIFFSGVGKSGFVAHKISQTLVSLGIRSAFLSPVDALHGDIGILKPSDVVVLFSKSGTTDELLRLVPCVRAKGSYLVSVTSVEGNALASACDMNVHLPVERELCPFDLAPVTSTAIQMVFGDTVAIALMGARNLTKEEYAANHPAGRIGKSLIFKVKDLMKKQDELPVCREEDLIMDQLVELTSKGCGCLLVIDEYHHLIGTFTDGDLRRTLKASGEGIFKLTVGEMCNRLCDLGFPLGRYKCIRANVGLKLCHIQWTSLTRTSKI